MHVRVIGEARDVGVGVARLHFVKGEVVRQNALWLVARGHGSPGGSLVASFLHACTKLKGVAVRGLYRGVSPPALLRRAWSRAPPLRQAPR